MIRHRRVSISLTQFGFHVAESVEWRREADRERSEAANVTRKQAHAVRGTACLASQIQLWLLLVLLARCVSKVEHDARMMMM